MKTAAPPIRIVRGEGALLYDDQGQSWIDGISSWWVNVHGHGHPYIAHRLAEQAKTLEHVIFAGFTHPPAEELALRLEKLLPSSLSAMFFSDNGSTAVEVAMKMAVQYHFNCGQSGRRKFIALEGAYHGDTFGAMAAGERNAFNAPFHDLLLEVEHLPFPEGPEAEAQCQERLERALEAGDVAGFIYEPLLQGTAGMRTYSPVILDGLIRLCQQHGVLCIADEVMTGFYRTGQVWASSYLSTTPDLMCLSKGLTGGTMALGLTVTSQDIYESFYDDDRMKAFYHGHSYTANPLACTAANASLELFMDPDCLESIDRICKAQRKLAQDFSHYPSIQVRQLGTMIAIDIPGGGDGYFASIRDELYSFSMNHGCLLRPLGNCLYLLPPYCITKGQLQQLHDVLTSAIMTYAGPS